MSERFRRRRLRSPTPTELKSTKNKDTLNSSKNVAVQLKLDLTLRSLIASLT